jgi:TPR repeat protein
MYANGQGVPQDYAEAVKWFRLAAERGDANAQYALGLMYERGHGVSQDYILTHMWFDLSAAQGTQIAVTSRDRIERQMAPAQIAEAQKLAHDWKGHFRPSNDVCAIPLSNRSRPNCRITASNVTGQEPEVTRPHH